MRSARPLLYFSPFFWGVFGCNLASAADGSTATTQAPLVASTTANPLPPSYPADAPPPHKPPQEAFDACQSLSEGAACSVNFNGQTMTGTCRKGPHAESELACMPGHPQGPAPSSSNQTLTDTAVERKLDQLEREIRGS